MQNQLAPEVLAVQAIGVVPTILEAVAAITGLRFVCIAHITADSWTTCAVLDQLDFGLKPGDGLDVTVPLPEEVLKVPSPIIIDKIIVGEQQYSDHLIPRIHGFESYISVPITRPNGDYFGSLCGLDPRPVNLSNTATIASMTMFAHLISLHLVSENKLAKAKAALLDERDTAELREQFIAVLGHDVRNPLGAILNSAQLLESMADATPKIQAVAKRIQGSAARIFGLVDDVVDFTRGKMGGGIGLELQHESDISASLKDVVIELSDAYPERTIESNISSDLTLVCDRGRIGQLLSNLLKNALVHGDKRLPISVRAECEGGLFQLSVTNGGVALSQQTQEQLFQPYWRATGSSSSQGLGLGLFIVSEIARSHGGTISVSSNSDATSFTFEMSAGSPLLLNRAVQESCNS